MSTTDVGESHFSYREDALNQSSSSSNGTQRERRSKRRSDGDADTDTGRDSHTATPKTSQAMSSPRRHRRTTRQTVQVSTSSIERGERAACPQGASGAGRAWASSSKDAMAPLMYAYPHVDHCQQHYIQRLSLPPCQQQRQQPTTYVTAGSPVMLPAIPMQPSGLVYASQPAALPRYCSPQRPLQLWRRSSLYSLEPLDMGFPQHGCCQQPLYHDHQNVSCLVASASVSPTRRPNEASSSWQVLDVDGSPVNIAVDSFGRPIPAMSSSPEKRRSQKESAASPTKGQTTKKQTTQKTIKVSKDGKTSNVTTALKVDSSTRVKVKTVETSTVTEEVARAASPAAIAKSAAPAALEPVKASDVSRSESTKKRAVSNVKGDSSDAEARRSPSKSSASQQASASKVIQMDNSSSVNPALKVDSLTTVKIKTVETSTVVEVSRTSTPPSEKRNISPTSARESVKGHEVSQSQSAKQPTWPDKNEPIDVELKESTSRSSSGGTTPRSPSRLAPRPPSPLATAAAASSWMKSFSSRSPQSQKASPEMVGQSEQLRRFGDDSERHSKPASPIPRAELQDVASWRWDAAAIPPKPPRAARPESPVRPGFDQSLEAERASRPASRVATPPTQPTPPTPPPPPKPATTSPAVQKPDALSKKRSKKPALASPGKPSASSTERNRNTDLQKSPRPVSISPSSRKKKPKKSIRSQLARYFEDILRDETTYNAELTGKPYECDWAMIKLYQITASWLKILQLWAYGSLMKGSDDSIENNYPERIEGLRPEFYHSLDNLMAKGKGLMKMLFGVDKQAMSAPQYERADIVSIENDAHQVALSVVEYVISKPQAAMLYSKKPSRRTRLRRQRRDGKLVWMDYNQEAAGNIHSVCRTMIRRAEHCLESVGSDLKIATVLRDASQPLALYYGKWPVIKAYMAVQLALRARTLMKLRTTTSPCRKIRLSSVYTDEKLGDSEIIRLVALFKRTIRPFFAVDFVSFDSSFFLSQPFPAYIELLQLAKAIVNDVKGSSASLA